MNYTRDSAILRLLGGNARPVPPLPQHGEYLSVGVRPEEARTGERSAEHAVLDEQLLVAAAAGNSSSVESLLQRGAHPNARDEKRWTPLVHAAESGNAETVWILLAAGARPNVVTKNGSAPLLFAGIRGDMEIVRLLLEAGASPNLFRNSSSTPLMAAVHSGPEMVNLMLAHGAEPGLMSPMRDPFAEAPLAASVRLGKMDVAEILLASGAPANPHYAIPSLTGEEGGPSFSMGPTPFMLAAWRDSIEMMELLLRHGADPLHVSDEVCTALCYAAKANAENAVRYLLKFDFPREHALERARSSGHLRIAQWLEQSGNGG